MNNILKKLSTAAIIPEVKIEDADVAVALVKALNDGGLSCAEVIFPASNAEKIIKTIADTIPHMIIGAGGVLNTEHVDKAVELGSKFIVTPELNPPIIRYCMEKSIPVIPCCSSPSDMEQALKLNLEVVKFFPVEALGGIKAIKSMTMKYDGLKFIPAGGINLKNMNQYLSLPYVLACGGSWMIEDEFIKSGDFDKITELTRQSINTMLGFELAHIGINSKNTSMASQVASTFSRMFGMDYREESSSIYAGKWFEIMKTTGLGKNGHIAVSTLNIERAVAYMQSWGYELDIDNLKKDADGNPAAIYFKQEIGGFAVHLTPKK